MGRVVRIYDAGHASVALLRHGNKREVRHLMDTAGWVSAEVILNSQSIAKFGLNADDLRTLTEIENETKTRFLMARGKETLFAKAAQGHSQGVSRNLKLDGALQVVKPGDADWCKVGLRGTREGNVQSILREGLDTKYSSGCEKCARIHFAPQVRDDLTDQPSLRGGGAAVVAVDLQALHEAGAVIYKSVDDVLLTAGFGGAIPPQYATKVLRMAGNVLWPVEEAPLRVESSWRSARSGGGF
eukprot:14007054-Alexandrium_andersonii.AAC.1